MPPGRSEREYAIRRVAMHLDQDMLSNADCIVLIQGLYVLLREGEDKVSKDTVEMFEEMIKRRMRRR